MTRLVLTSYDGKDKITISDDQELDVEADKKDKPKNIKDAVRWLREKKKKD